jgi:hypothetical protein
LSGHIRASEDERSSENREGGTAAALLYALGFASHRIGPGRLGMFGMFGGGGMQR